MNSKEQYLKRKAQVRQEAVDWGNEFNNCRYSWGELAEWQAHFYTLGKRYGLLLEFHENGIC